MKNIEIIVSFYDPSYIYVYVCVSLVSNYHDKSSELRVARTITFLTGM